MIKRTTTTGSPRTTALAESLSERSVVTSSHSHEDDSRKMIGTHTTRPSCAWMREEQAMARPRCRPHKVEQVAVRTPLMLRQRQSAASAKVKPSTSYTRRSPMRTCAKCCQRWLMAHLLRFGSGSQAVLTQLSLAVGVLARDAGT